MKWISKLDAANYVVTALQVADFEAYLVGGCVRDMLLGREPKDYDVCTSAEPADVQALFPKTLIVGAQFGVVVVVLDDIQIEVATYRTDGKYTDGRRPDNVSFAKTLREDVQRRDFTINGMAARTLMQIHDETDFSLVDHVDGYKDLKAKVIRCIGDPKERIQEDALRMMRAVRFACQLGFTIEDNTFRAIKIFAPLIRKVSWERIREELIKILVSPDSYGGLTLMCRTGLMQFVFPELLECGLGQAFYSLEKLSRFNSPLLRLAALLDVCPERVQMADRLKLSNDDKAYLMRLWTWPYLKDFATKTRAEQIRFYRLPRFEDVWRMYYARTDFGDRTAAAVAVNDLNDVDLNPKPLLTGDDLKNMGFEAGPIFKTILDWLETKQLNGQITDVNYAKRMVPWEFEHYLRDQEVKDLEIGEIL